MQAQAFLESAAVSVGLDTYWGYTKFKKRVPNSEAVGEWEVKFPALFADIADSEGPNLDPADRDFLGGCEWERLARDALRIKGQAVKDLRRETMEK